MRHILKTVSILSALATFALFANDSLQSQQRPLPVGVTCREAILSRSYVLQIQNSSNQALDLWMQAKGKISSFLLPAGKMVKFGWAQGYHFDANNLFLIGASGYDTIKQVMPNTELSLWRIDFPNDGGLALSLSQSFLQNQLSKYLGLPIKENVSGVLEIALSQAPEIVLTEGSEKIYADAILQASLLSNKLHFPIAAKVSFIPLYSPGNGRITASQIAVENIDVNALPREWLDVATQIVNKMLPALFAKVVIYQLDKSQSRIAKLVNLRSVRVSDRRLEILIL
jgi:hypothetical protein